MAEMQFDFDGLIQLLANNLYSEKKVFIRELIQNSHDAIQRRAKADPNFSIEMGRIDIYTDLSNKPATIKFSDNGVGMTKSDLEDYLSSVGSSGTRTNEEEAPDVIGQFGIGFLSAFVVANRVVVKTKSWKDINEDGWIWENEGRKDYQLKPELKEEVGTEVTAYLASAEDNGLVQDKAIREVVRLYADMLKIPIYLNFSESSINTRIMPWERKEISSEERDIDCRIYLEKNMPDSVLEVIPLDETGDANISGVLYITRTRVIGRDTPRVLRVFQKRMFLCESTSEILPRWAGFVNGIFNTSTLKPNAARDNFQRDENFEKIRDRLGELIITHFEKLKETNQERLSEILAYHDFQIKAACHYYDAFFEKFGHLLEWKVNSKSPAAVNARLGGRHSTMFDEVGDYAWVTLPDLVAALPEPENDGLKRLNCFTSHASANQFFEMANAAGSSVLDASAGFETELIKTWASNHPEIRLVYVDREDDPNIFREIDSNTDKKVQELANQMSLYIRSGGTGRMRVEARSFEPTELPAVLKSSPESSGANKANQILNDPDASASLREMAEEMRRLAHNADMRMTINATNPLIRELASLDDFEDPEVIDLMAGIYNDAILYNQELMTPSNAKVFHEQYGRLLHRAVEYLQQRDQLRLYEKKEAQRQQLTKDDNRQHKVAFYMTPFNESFDDVREAVRMVVEDELGCQLLTADQITYDELIKGNVRQHIDGADFYIADVTGANPNVMQELGAVHYGRSASPTLLIAGLKEGQNTPELPADLQGHITSGYQQGSTSETIAEVLLPAFKANQQLKQLLDDSSRETYLSPETLRKFTRNVLSDDKNYKRLSQKFATTSAWRNTNQTELETIIVDEAELANAVLKRVLDHLDSMA